jgi:hypothetical protein
MVMICAVVMDPRLRARASWPVGASRTSPLDEFLYVTVEFMPKDLPASLGEVEYTDVVAYVLRRKGYEPGREPLTAEPARNRGIAVVPPATRR